MSDFRNANDPLQRSTPEELSTQNLNTPGKGGALAWIAGAVLVVILAALVIGIDHSDTTSNSGPTVASNNTPMNRLAPPPSGPANPAFTPAPMNPANPTNPVAPAPAAPPPPK
jgi:hypothetical protein